MYRYFINRSAAIAEKTCLEIIMMMMMVFSVRNLVVDQNQDEDDPDDEEEEDQSADHLTCEICNFILEKCSATPRTA